MIDPLLARLAFRQRALSLVVATTGSATLAATADGYTRTVGSFVDDGLLPGMELVPSGFTQTTPAIIGKVEPSLVTIVGGRTVQSAGGGRSLSVGLPLQRVWELVDVTPNPTRPFIAEEWVPGGAGITTWPVDGGRLEEDGLSLWHWYGLPGYDVAAIERCVFALKKLFAAGTLLSLTDGSSVRVRSAVTVKQSGIRRIGAHGVITLTVPWITWTTNVIAA